MRPLTAQNPFCLVGTPQTGPHDADGPPGLLSSGSSSDDEQVATGAPRARGRGRGRGRGAGRGPGRGRGRGAPAGRGAAGRAGGGDDSDGPPTLLDHSSAEEGEDETEPGVPAGASHRHRSTDSPPPGLLSDEYGSDEVEDEDEEYDEDDELMYHGDEEEEYDEGDGEHGPPGFGVGPSGDPLDFAEMMGQMRNHPMFGMLAHLPIAGGGLFGGPMPPGLAAHLAEMQDAFTAGATPEDVMRAMMAAATGLAGGAGPNLRGPAERRVALSPEAVVASQDRWLQAQAAEQARINADAAQLLAVPDSAPVFVDACGVTAVSQGAVSEAVRTALADPAFVDALLARMAAAARSGEGGGSSQLNGPNVQRAVHLLRSEARA